jgi:hypothetical protein
VCFMFRSYKDCLNKCHLPGKDSLLGLHN